ncbi:MAG: glycerol-3-phosphate 1-O-acyltransferase PlsY [Acidimicrobiia bacterium]|nr:glycerol-3-phosphate 1-O-acyltransferase PlsY [Acidimicrobiia bacterium]MDH4306322.1 glycerol-3-phosphate 1-O-acyltransferase PlsY [Acidimicrobiia bacterium]MDH5294177.1 glycerol-3-phosphate 1-O-acyltransferase PlsY [Acidimicrobiia bacterium]
MPTWLALIGAYFIGSLDFAVVVARAHGVDIHSVGSGNPGASNVLRTLGRGPAAMVFLGDALKGVIAAAIGWLAGGAGDPANQPIAFAAGFLAVAGHCFPIFHRFKGGKGVATAAGVIVFTVPVVGFILAALWTLVAKVFKVASIASLVAVVATVPLAFWQGTRGAALAWLGGMLALIVVRHAPNIRRMISGSEQKVPT